MLLVLQRNKKSARRTSRAILALHRLEDRLTPAPTTYTWTGTASTAWITQGNWDSGDGTPGNDGYPDDSGDTAKFDNDTTNKPVLAANVPPLTLKRIETTANWPGTITVNGDILVSETSLAGSGSMEGSGSLTLGGTGSVTHTWTGLKVKVPTIKIINNAYLQVEGTPQIGPDDNTGSVEIGGAGSGKVEMLSGFKLGSEIKILGQGSFIAAANAALTHAGNATPGEYTVHVLDVNGGPSGGGLLEVTTFKTLTLNGVALHQSHSEAQTVISSHGVISISDNTAYALANTDAVHHINYIAGTLKMYPYSTLLASSGEVHIKDGADLDIYCPGYYELPTGVGHNGEVAIGGTKVKFSGTGTVISFKDYTPNGATNVLQKGAVLKIWGDLSILGSTDVRVRLLDYIDTGDRDCALDSTTSLHISGTPDQFDDPFHWEVIWCGEDGTLTGEFGGISDPPDGWLWVPGAPLYSPNALTISWFYDS